MKTNKILSILSIVCLSLLTSSCGKNNPKRPNNEKVREEYAFKEMPHLIVELGSTITEVEKAENAAKSVERKRTTVAGYTTIEFDTKNEQIPYRLYMFRNDVGKLTIAALVVIPNSAIWEEETINKQFADLFSQGGYIFKERTNHDGLKSFFFIKNEVKDGFTHIECRLNKESAPNNYMDQECTRLSYRRTDIID